MIFDHRITTYSEVPEVFKNMTPEQKQRFDTTANVLIGSDGYCNCRVNGSCDGCVALYSYWKGITNSTSCPRTDAKALAELYVNTVIPILDAGTKIDVSTDVDYDSKYGVIERNL